MQAWPLAQPWRRLHSWRIRQWCLAILFWRSVVSPSRRWRRSAAARAPMAKIPRLVKDLGAGDGPRPDVTGTPDGGYAGLAAGAGAAG
jgi:hypothetical protein